MARRPSPYQRQIVELSGCEPGEAPLVEAHMRLMFGSLDGLARARFQREAQEALTLVRADPAAAAELAGTYGL